MLSESTKTSSNHPSAPSIRIFAKSVYKELCSQGHSPSEIIAFTNELLDLMTTELAQSTANEEEIVS